MAYNFRERFVGLLPGGFWPSRISQMPFTDFHQLDLDWILRAMKTVLDQMKYYFIDGGSKETIEEVIAEHPEWVTTVMDGAITYPKLNNSLKSYVTPEMFDAIDDAGNIKIAEFSDMVAYAVNNDKTIKFINDYVFNFIPGSTVQNPTRIKIENVNNLYIDGGGHTVYMKGCTKTYLQSINDISSSGRDIFTFLAFHECRNITVKNLYITGENPEELQRFRFASPRSIGISFKGCDTCLVENIHGDHILGNCINATTADDLASGSNNIFVTDCTASHCWENGFNLMGYTTNSKIDGCTSTYNQSGYEIAETSNIINNSIAAYNYLTGVALSGGNLLNSIIANTQGDGGSNDTGTGVRISTNIGRSIIKNNRFENNFGFAFHVYPGVNNTIIDNNTFINDTLTHSWGVSWYVVGTDAKPIDNLTITNNKAYTTRNTGRFLQGAYTNKLVCTGNTIKTESPTTELYLTSQGNDNFIIADNILKNGVTYTATDRTYYVSNIVNYRRV